MISIFIASLLVLLHSAGCANIPISESGIGVNFDDNTIQFPHDSCQSEIHGKFEFSKFHNANPFYDEEGNFEMLVRFKGVADGHIALTENGNTSEPLYLIIVGSYNNRITEIRRTKAAKPEVKLDTPQILSSHQWRGFIIRYNLKTGNLQVLPEGIDVPLLQWVDPKPLNVAFFSFTTYIGRVLQVAYDCRAKDTFSSVPKTAGACKSTTVRGDSFDVFYETLPFLNDFGILELLVRFRGPSDGHIFLSTSRNESLGGYFVIIGSFENTQSEIRRSMWSAPVFKIRTPEIMSDIEFRGFVVRYYRETGVLRVYPEGSEMPLLHWTDENPLQIRFFSFAAYVDIVVEVLFNCQAKDAYSLAPHHSKKSGSDGTSTAPDPKLRKKILENYDPMAQPYPAGIPVTTTVTMSSLNVIHYNIDDKEQTLEIHAWLYMSWFDERLRWSQYARDRAGFLHFKKSEIWRPDITIYNTAKPKVMDEFADEAQILVKGNGTAIWIPPIRILTNCEMNFLQWPFDTQECYLKLGSWTFSEEEIDLQLGPGDPNSSISVMSYQGHSFANNTEWQITDTSVVRTSRKYACCEDNYVDVTYNFKLARKYSSYAYTVIFPVVMISVISVFNILLPSFELSRIVLSCFNFLTIAAYLIYFRMRLPTIDHVPHIVKLFVWNLFVNTVNIILAIILTLLRNIGAKKSGPPEWAKFIINSGVGSFLCLGQTSDSDKGAGSVRTQENNTNQNYETNTENPVYVGSQKLNQSANKDWEITLRLIDRFAFVLAAFLTFIMLLCHLC